jgi:hypothetical protein
MKYIKIYEGFWSDRKKRRASDKSIQKADKELNKHISKFIGKKYGFQYKVVVWKSKNSNYTEIDHDQLTFNGLEIEPTYYDTTTDNASGVFLYLLFTDKNNDIVNIYFPTDAVTNNLVDLEYAKPWELYKNTLKGDISLQEVDIENTNFDDPKRYPKRDNNLVYVPSEYKTIELLTELKGLLQSVNDQFTSL